DFQALRKTVASGSVGTPFHLESFIGGYGHPCSYWHSHEPISGGILFDWGSHYLDWTLQLFTQPVASVSAVAQKLAWQDVTNADQVNVDVRFEGGAQATFLHSEAHVDVHLVRVGYILPGQLLGDGGDAR